MVFLLLLFLPVLLSAHWYSKEKLLNKIQSPPPEWMMKQIREDLSGFAENGFDSTSIHRTHAVYNVPIGKDIAHLQYFSIRDNVVYSGDGWRHWRVEKIHNFLTDLASIAPLPDVDFLYSLWDMFDNPSFLEVTQCPVFTICKYRDNRKALVVPDVTWPVLQNRQGDVHDIKWMSSNRPWEERNNFAFWRGSTTDITYYEGMWDYRQRPRLIFFSLLHPDLVNARYVFPPAGLQDHLLNYFCELGMIVDKYIFRYWTNFRYLIAVDGVSYPSALHGELFSGSTVLKAKSEFVEWFHQALQPYVHYVPYKVDCSDLEEKILWLKANQDEAKRIAKNAFDFADNNLQAEDIMLYYYLVLTEYAKLQTL